MSNLLGLGTLAKFHATSRETKKRGPIHRGTQQTKAANRQKAELPQSQSVSRNEATPTDPKDASRQRG